MLVESGRTKRIYHCKRIRQVFNMEDRIQCNNDNADVFDNSRGNTLTPDSLPGKETETTPDWSFKSLFFINNYNDDSISAIDYLQSC